LDPSTDSGSDNTDNITNKTSLTLLGTATPGSTVVIFDDINDNNQIDDGELLTTIATVGVTGAYTAYVKLGTGEHRLRAIASDKEGNISLASGSLPITVDLEPVATPLSIALLPTSDTGQRSDDRQTTVTLPVFRVALPVDARVGDVLWLVSGTSYQTDPTLADSLATYTLQAGDLVDAGRGYVDLQVKRSLAGGKYTIGTYVIDLAGNIGRMQVLQAVVIDTTAPVAPVISGLQASDDTGTSSSDGLTVRGTGFTLRGTAQSGTRFVEIFENGQKGRRES
jgi:hypothetical protein